MDVLQEAPDLRSENMFEGQMFGRDDMDVDAGRILEGRGTLGEVGREILALIERVASGERTCSEALGHQEFILGYKRFEPTGPACLPRAA